VTLSDKADAKKLPNSLTLTVTFALFYLMKQLFSSHPG